MTEATVITNPCPVCKERSIIPVDVDGYIKWKVGAFIQDAFPDLSADERELIMTGTHPACWDKMFPPGEES